MAFGIWHSAFAAACVGRDAPARLTIAVGPAGSSFEACGRALADLVTDSDISITVTGGAVESLQALGRGRAQMTLTPADTLAQAVNGEGLFAGRTVSALTLASLYTSGLHLVVPSTSSIHGFSQLRDHTVGVATPQSGTDLTARRALEVALLEERVTAHPVSLPEGVRAMAAGGLDALFWLDGVPSAALGGTLGPGRAKLVNTSSVVALLQRRYGATLYESAEIAPAVYGLPDPTATVGVPTVLVSRHDLPDAVGYSVVRDLLQRTSAFVAGCPAARDLDLNRAARSTPAARQPGAARFYREAGVR